MIPRATPEFHINDFGTVLEFEIRSGRNRVLDLSQDFCAAEIIFMRPDGSAFTRPAQLLPPEDSATVPGTDGIVFYVLQPGDFTVSGNWFLQVFVAFAAGGWYSSVLNVIVFPNLIDINSEVLSP